MLWRLDEVLYVLNQFGLSPCCALNFSWYSLFLYQYNILYLGIKIKYGPGFFTNNWRAVLVFEVQGEVLEESM